MFKVAALPSVLACASSWFSWRALAASEGLSAELLFSIAQVYVSVSVTMVGFTLAMLAILVSASGTRLIRNMSKTGHYDRVNARFLVTAAFFGATLVSSLASLFLSTGLVKVGMSISTGLLVGAGWALMVSARKFWLVLKLVSVDKSGRLE